jgi:AraC-like DNA-binding protein
MTASIAHESPTLPLMKPAAHDFSRRHFLCAALAGPGVLPVAAWTAASAAPADSTSFDEPGQKLQLVQDADVIVCGAGPAGVAAAVNAARAGARVRLFEVNGCLGGVWTAGLLTWIFDFDKPGFTRELTRHLDERGARRGGDAGRFVYEPDEMKLLLEDLCAEAGVKFRLHTRVVAAYREGRQLTTVVTESRSGREAWRAPVFIDTTGDGVLGALLGSALEAHLDQGHPLRLQRLHHLASALLHAAFSKLEVPLLAAHPERLTGLLALIDQALHTNLGNAFLAGHVGMSTERFIRWFRQHMQQTPAVYVTTMRVRRAQQMLALSDKTIEQVSAETGFPNRHYFSRVFARQVGCGPAEFRKRQRERKGL